MGHCDRLNWGNHGTLYQQIPNIQYILLLTPVLPRYRIFPPLPVTRCSWYYSDYSSILPLYFVRDHYRPRSTEVTLPDLTWRHTVRLWDSDTLIRIVGVPVTPTGPLLFFTKRLLLVFGLRLMKLLLYRYRSSSHPLLFDTHSIGPLPRYNLLLPTFFLTYTSLKVGLEVRPRLPSHPPFSLFLSLIEGSSSNVFLTRIVHLRSSVNCVTTCHEILSLSGLKTGLRRLKIDTLDPGKLSKLSRG